DSVFVIAYTDPCVVAGNWQRVGDITIVQTLAASVFCRQDVADAQYVGHRTLKLAPHRADRRHLVVGDLSVERKTICFNDVRVKPGFARLEPRNQLEIEPLYKRVLQEDQLLAL